MPETSNANSKRLTVREVALLGNRILAHYSHDQNAATLWELPGQGVYLTHSDSVNVIRICSKEEFDSFAHVLVRHGWILDQ